MAGLPPEGRIAVPQGPTDYFCLEIQFFSRKAEPPGPPLQGRVCGENLAPFFRSGCSKSLSPCLEGQVHAS